VEIAKSARVVLEIKYPESENEKELSQEGGEIPGLVIESSLLPESENPVTSRALYGKFSALEGEQVESARVSDTGELILKKKNQSQLRAGNVIGPKGDRGEKGPQGEKGDRGDKGEKGLDADYSLIANALTGREKGAAVRLADVSPFPHEIRVQLSGKEELLFICTNADGEISEDITEGRYVVAQKEGNRIYFEGGERFEIGNFSDFVREDDIRIGDMIEFEFFPVEMWGDEGEWKAFLTREGDYSAVSLKKCGKNLLESDGYSAASYQGVLANTSYGTTISTTEAVNGLTVTQSKYPTPSALTSYENGYFFIFLKSIPSYGEYYTISCDIEILDNPLGADVFQFLFCGSGGTYSSFFNDKAFEVGRKYRVHGYWTFADNGKSSIEVRNCGMSLILSNIQLEKGVAATEFEPVEKPVTYVANADGRVEGVTSLYPETNLVTDDTDVKITAVYHRDINQVIRRLESALIHIGDEV
jgi:hypothetical protein